MRMALTILPIRQYTIYIQIFHPEILEMELPVPDVWTAGKIFCNRDRINNLLSVYPESSFPPGETMQIKISDRWQQINTPPGLLLPLLPCEGEVLHEIKFHLKEFFFFGKAGNGDSHKTDGDQTGIRFMQQGTDRFKDHIAV